VDAKGNQTVLYNQNNFTISGAKKARNGDIYVVTNAGRISRLDRTGKEVKTFQVGQMYFFGGVELLPGGRVLVAEYRNNRVAEYDAQGKLVWHAQANFPTSAVRLPNGHTLVTIMINQQIVELNRDGKVVWQHHVADGRPFRARRR
jgi:outer membrane protein assembly factor BamB